MYDRYCNLLLTTNKSKQLDLKEYEKYMRRYNFVIPNLGRVICVRYPN